jgi:hypothetical protein
VLKAVESIFQGVRAFNSMHSGYSSGGVDLLLKKYVVRVL